MVTGYNICMILIRANIFTEEGSNRAKKGESCFALAVFDILIYFFNILIINDENI